MNALASEYGSGSDSGWTVYLEQSVLSPNDHRTNFIESKTCFYSSGKKIMIEDDDDESMVSDASSGPPQLNDDYSNNNGYFSSAFEDMHSNSMMHHGGKRKKMKEQRRRYRGGKGQELVSYLDDTASSPTNFSKKNFSLINKHQASMNGVLEYSQGFSATRFKGRSK